MTIDATCMTLQAVQHMYTAHCAQSQTHPRSIKPAEVPGEVLASERSRFKSIKGAMDGAAAARTMVGGLGTPDQP